ncbi:histidine--tRNA ligase [Clostridium oryzae]|uniref:Histidine--tRNA ligase n=1 Tax=Clostridium oryzae TaxID=1450648 RepID=A0A1V4IR27_9CLOT|nr:histidine--tRNA ligase [Clostridium oryzae]OPJ62254.1 histidine--tRNA ligase [Clostridium oryzae]
MIKPSILPGFMELLPEDQMLFNKVKDTIRKNYEKFGFIPLDTPVMEKSEVLLAKGGGETEKQIYRFSKGDTDISLRFDLTVPLARYVSQHSNDIAFPFRRYQIGKVYRGERNQKGRFREFYQCDIDIIGNEKLSIMYDAEIPSVIYSIFKELNFGDFVIRINNRKVLNGFFKSLDIEDVSEILRIIDKIDKIGADAVKEEITALGVSADIVEKIMSFIALEGNNDSIIEGLKALKIENEAFTEGIAELEAVTNHIKYFGVPEENFAIDLKIARGLDYYTGTVYETILKDYPSIGSVCSGGRYDNLAGYYTNQKLPGVGISIGLTRLFYQLREANLIKTDGNSTPAKILVIPMDDDTSYSIEVSKTLRTAGIECEVYFEKGKLNKKLNYANKLGIPYVILIGSDEVETGKLTFKDMKKGEQSKLTVEEIINQY